MMNSSPARATAATRMSTLVLAFTCWLSFMVSSVNGQCALCDVAGQYPHADKMGATPQKAPAGFENKDCLSLYIEANALPPNSCSSLKDFVINNNQGTIHDFCCAGSNNNGSTGNGGGKQEGGWTSPVGRGCHNRAKGNEGVCMICMTDEFPGVGDDNSIHARYYGDFTCAQLYDRGRNGEIPGFLCGQLQNFA